MKKISLIGALSLSLSLLLANQSSAQVGAAPNGGIVIQPSPSNSSTYTANTFCLDQTNKDVYIGRVGTNDLGIYTNATNCATGTLRFDVSATAVNFGVSTLNVPDATFTIQAPGSDIIALRTQNSSTIGWRVSAAGMWEPLNDNTEDVGVSGGNNIRRAYLGGAAALGTTSTDGYVAQNTTAAVVGTTVQISPRNKWCGTAYNSVSTLSETDCFIAEVLPATVAGTTTAQWNLSSSIAGGAFSNVLSVSQVGTATFAAALVAGSNIQLGNTGILAFNGRTHFTAPGDGTGNITNSAATSGIGYDVTTDSTIWFKTRAFADTAIVKANVFTATATGNAFILPSSGVVVWTGLSRLVTATDGEVSLTNNANTTGVVFDATVDSKVRIRNRADNAYGNISALAFLASDTPITSGTTHLSAGSGMAVANVGANSCGTTSATIAGNNNANVTTVGATAGTQCRITFTIAAATEWDCSANDDTTTVAVRTTPVDTTHTDIIGTFTAGDKVTAICFPR